MNTKRREPPISLVIWSFHLCRGKHLSSSFFDFVRVVGMRWCASIYIFSHHEIRCIVIRLHWTINLSGKRKNRNNSMDRFCQDNQKQDKRKDNEKYFVPMVLHYLRCRIKSNLARVFQGIQIWLQWILFFNYSFLLIVTVLEILANLTWKFHRSDKVSLIFYTKRVKSLIQINEFSIGFWKIVSGHYDPEHDAIKAF